MITLLRNVTECYLLYLSLATVMLIFVQHVSSPNASFTTRKGFITNVGGK